MSGRTTAERQSSAAAQQIEQLKQDLNNALLDASVARRDSEARAAQLVAARAQVEQLQRESSQAQLTVSKARRETAAHAALLARAGEQIEQLQGEVARTRFLQEGEHSASVLLADQLVEAENQIEQLFKQLASRKPVAETGTRQLREELEQALARERFAQERAVALEQSHQLIRAMLDRATSKATTLQQVIGEKDALLNGANERCWLLKAELERLTGERGLASARRPESYAASKQKHRRKGARNLEIQPAPAEDEQLNQLARRINVEPLRGQARRAAESVEQRRVLLSASAADEEQQYHDWLADLNEQGYRAEDDPLVAMKIQELQAQHEFAREQRLHGRHGRAQLLQPGTDLLRVAVVWAMQARQLYIHDPPSHRAGEVYWQQDFICLDEESEQDLLRTVTEAFFRWRQKLYRYR